MSVKDFKRGVEAVSKPLNEKFDVLNDGLSDVTKTVENGFSKIDEATEVLRSDQELLWDEVAQLKDARQYIKSSRHSLDDMDIEEQHLLISWLQKVLEEIEKQGVQINSNQQSFFSNLIRYIGMMDENYEIENLNILEKMGDSETHEVIYKVFLPLIYLHDGSFSLIEKISYIDNMFKLSSQTKLENRKLLEDRVRGIGIEGLINIFNQEKAINSFKLTSVFTSDADLESHPALKWGWGIEEFKVYLLGFAVLGALHAENYAGEKIFELNVKQKEFLGSLCKAFKTPSVIFEIDELCKAPQRYSFAGLTQLLNSDEKKYTWLLDLIMVASQDESLQNFNRVYEILLQKLGIARSQSFIENALKLVKSDESVELGQSLVAVAKNTKGFQHILKFRCVSLLNAFQDTQNNIVTLSSKMAHLLVDNSSISFDMMKDKMAGLDRGEFSLSKSQKKSYLKRLESYRNSVLKLIEDNYTEIKSIENMFSHINIDNSEVSSITEIQNFIEKLNFNLDTEFDDEYEWDNFFEKLMTDLNDKISKINDLLCIYQEQLTYFEEQKFISAHLEKKQLKEEERKSREAVELILNGQSKTISFEWEEIEDSSIPFSLNSVSKSVSCNNIWLVITNDTNSFFSSEDGKSWHEHDTIPFKGKDIHIESIKYLNELYIIETSSWTSSHIYYSKDLSNWNEASWSKDSKVFFDGKYWLKISSKETEYTYTEPGLIWDSKKKSTYDKPQIFRSTSLDGKWELYDNLSLEKGRIIKGEIFHINNMYIIPSVYDWRYKEDKKLSSEDFKFSYMTSKMSYLTDCKMDEKFNRDTASNIHFTSWRDCIIAKCSYDILTSEDGITWKKEEEWFSGEKIIALNEFLIGLPTYSEEIHVSADGKTFSPVALEKGNWKFFDGVCNGDTLLAVFSKNKGQEVLRVGKITLM